MDSLPSSTTRVPTSNVFICASARHKMKERGLHTDFVRTCFHNGEWFHDELDSTVMHARWHGHDCICRWRNNQLFLITVNTNVSKTHKMKKMSQSPYQYVDTADTATNWRRKTPIAVSDQPFKDVLKIAERIMKDHKSYRWIGSDR